MSLETVDVIVIGSGNAGFSVAASARENGASKVLLLEKAPESWAGGNTTFTAGAYRTAFAGLEDLLPIVHNVNDELAKQIEMQPYSVDDFLHDIMRVTNHQCDPDLAGTLCKESNDTTKWLARNGIQFTFSFNRQAYRIGSRHKFWGGMVLCVVNGGKGLTQQHQANVARKGVEVRYEHPVVHLLPDHKGGIKGVSVRRKDNTQYDVLARGGVVMCAGGFEANSSLRARYLGPDWEKAYVRGTPYNTGDLLKLAIEEAGARTTGDWSGCHSTCWDANASTGAGDQVLTNQFTKSGYPLGVMINSEGVRFVNEGLDMRNYTYAKFGREVLGQPGSICFQIWDADGAAWLRSEEYNENVVERVTATSIEKLAEKLLPKGLKAPFEFVKTLREYNKAAMAHQQEYPDRRFDPSIKDGLSTKGLAIEKTNWATPIVKPPFLAVKVACGVTFTFGGLKIESGSAAVLSRDTMQPIPGLYAAGEMVGGLFYDNYPGGSGLTQGAVFGRKAGASAAKRCSSPFPSKATI